MKKTRFTEAQIMGVLRQMEGGVPAAELCREHGMSSATLYKWRAKYGGMDASLISESEPCPPLVRGQLSRDTQSYDLRRQPVLRGVAQRSGSGARADRQESERAPSGPRAVGLWVVQPFRASARSRSL